eukprot:SAG31_NODE_33427_length_344_cov_0.600000_1_plen_68_part_00
MPPPRTRGGVACSKWLLRCCVLAAVRRPAAAQLFQYDWKQEVRCPGLQIWGTDLPCNFEYFVPVSLF